MLTLTKKLVIYSLDGLNFPDFFLKLSGNKPRIFLYHGVAPVLSDYGIFNYRQKFIEPEAFGRHLIWLKRRFTVLPLSTIIERLIHKKEFKEPVCALTFDDGYENLHRYAFPVLKELKAPATAFLTTDLVDQKSPLWVDRLEYALGMTDLTKIEVGPMKKTFSLESYSERCQADNEIRSFLKKVSQEEGAKTLGEVVKICGKDLKENFQNSPYRGMTWDQAREMEKHGIEFAPHTLSHPILSRIDDEAAEEEIKKSYDRVKTELRKPLPIFAYPNGLKTDFTERTALILKKLGFVSALTTIPGTILPEDSLFNLPRFSLDGTNKMPVFRITASGVKDFLSSLTK